MANAKGKAVKRASIVIGIVLVALFAVAAWYVNDYYRADADALAVVADEDGDADGVVVRTLADSSLAFVPRNPVAGFIFYPGGKVQPESYAPLMQKCAQRGLLCVMVKPLFNLAILDMNAADGLQAQFPDVQTWYIGGHSLGGVAAADYVGRHQGDYQGVVFLAAFPANDLSEYDGAVLSIAGENDQVLNWQSYDDARDMLPESAEWIQVEGGNHSNFGNYGEQAGDGTATITRQAQQELTADAIAGLRK